MKPKLALACLLCLVISGCSGGAHPASSFKQEGTRVFESYGQSGDVTKKVTLPKGTTSLRLTMDCINKKGDIEVAVASGVGGGPCGEASGEVGIALGPAAGKPFERQQTVKVTVPKDAEWSVAVDAVTTPDAG